MTYSVYLTTSLKRSIRKLKRRYPRVQDDVRDGVEALLQSPRLGVVIPNSGGVRKLRLRNRDAQRGKSGGYRMLYYLEDIPSQRLYLLFVYSKSEREDVTQRQLDELLQEITNSDE